VRGRLQKDGATLNVIAETIEALRVPGAPVRRRGLSRSYAETAASGGSSGDLAATVREGAEGFQNTSEPDSFGELQASLPDTMEYWADSDRMGPDPFRYLTALRQSPPGIKSFG